MNVTQDGMSMLMHGFMNGLKPEPGHCMYCGGQEGILETKLGPLCPECNMKAIAQRLEGVRPYGTMYVGLFTEVRPGQDLVEVSGEGYARQHVTMLKEGYNAAKGAHPVLFRAQADWSQELEGYFLANTREGSPLMYENFDRSFQLSDGAMLKVNVRLEFG